MCEFNCSGQQARSQDCMEGVRLGGPGFPPVGVEGQAPPRGGGGAPAPNIFDIFC